MYTECNMLAIRQLKEFHFNFDLPIDVDKNLKHENEFDVKREIKWKQAWNKKTSLTNYCTNISMDTIVMNTEISKISEPYKFVFNFLQRLNQIISNKHIIYFYAQKIFCLSPKCVTKEFNVFKDLNYWVWLNYHNIYGSKW